MVLKKIKVSSKKETKSVKKAIKEDKKVVQDAKISKEDEIKLNKKPEEEKVLLTKDGLKKLQEELESLKTTKRKEIAEKLQSAISYGDLSENAEYDEAKNEQALLETRIMELQSIIEKAQIISTSHTTVSLVELGCKVSVNNLTYNKKEEYKIVGSTESDPLNGLISNESPVGKALLGLQAGDLVKIVIPKGEVEYKILKIE